MQVQVRPGRPEAAAAIWDPKGADPARERAAAARAARRGGALRAAVGATAGGALFWLWSQWIGSVVLTVSALLLLASSLSPTGLYAVIERGFAALGRWTGAALTAVTMTAVFYLIFFPFGALFRRGRRDPMQRFYEPERESYWNGRESGRSGSASHLRQY